MKVVLQYIFLLAVGCSNTQHVNQMDFCDDCPIDNSGLYTVDKLNSLISQKMILDNDPDSLLKFDLLQCFNKKNSPNIELHYLSIDTKRGLRHLVSKSEYSLEFWGVSFNKNNSINYCFLAAASGGDGGDGFEVFSNWMDDVLVQSKVFKSVFLDSLTNDFTDSLRTEIITKEYKLENNTLLILKSDSSSRITKWDYH